MSERECRPELLDEQEWPLDEVSGNLRDMERAHAVLGVRRRVLSFADRVEAPDVPLTVLDLGTGSGWLPRALHARAAARGRTLRVVGLDCNRTVLEVARRSGGAPLYCRADVRSLPFPARSFDLVTCSMSLHHFSRNDALELLRTMDAIARRGWILCDLVRSRSLVWLASAATRVFSANALTRHDGPASARRAFSLRELGELALDAGVTGAVVRRFSLVCGEIAKRSRR
ncbi:MAG: methyltransferase domain-containing protein [Deltaproteobacteria bacterium]|nr:methyltransferase domain-containing protein [Deltaproteobacteria bacterium]